MGLGGDADRPTVGGRRPLGGMSLSSAALTIATLNLSMEQTVITRYIRGMYDGKEYDKRALATNDHQKWTVGKRPATAGKTREIVGSGR